MEVLSPELTRPSFPDNYHPSYPPAASSVYNSGEELRILNISENDRSALLRNDSVLLSV